MERPELVRLLHDAGRMLEERVTVMPNHLDAVTRHLFDIFAEHQFGFYPTAHQQPAWYLIGFTHAQPDFGKATHIPDSLRIPGYRNTLRALIDILHDIDVSQSYLGLEDLPPNMKYAPAQSDDPLWLDFIRVLRGSRIAYGGNQLPDIAAAMATAHGDTTTALAEGLTHAVAIDIVERQVVPHIRAMSPKYRGPKFYGMGQGLIPAVSAALSEAEIPHVAVVQR